MKFKAYIFLCLIFAILFISSTVVAEKIQVDKESKSYIPSYDACTIINIFRFFEENIFLSSKAAKFFSNKYLLCFFVHAPRESF